MMSDKKVSFFCCYSIPKKVLFLKENLVECFIRVIKCKGCALYFIMAGFVGHSHNLLALSEHKAEHLINT